LKAYTGMAHAYHRWARHNGIFSAKHGGSIPVPTPLDLTFYVEHRHNKGDVVQTLKSRLSAISWHCKQHRQGDPCKNPDGSTIQIMKDIIRGISRDQKGAATRTRKPITVPLAGIIIDNLAAADPGLCAYDQEAYAALILAGIYILLRASEQCTKLVREYDPRIHLLGRDVTFTYDSDGKATEGHLLIKAAKEDLFRDTQILTMHATGGRNCPVRRLHAWATRRTAGPNQPFYTLKDGSYITQDRLTKRLRKTLNYTGRVGKDWATHSLRSGGAISLAASSSMSSEVLALVGRWKSDSKLLYLKHLPSSVLRRAHKQMGRLTTKDITEDNIRTYDNRFEE